MRSFGQGVWCLRQKVWLRHAGCKSLAPWACLRTRHLWRISSCLEPSHPYQGDPLKFSRLWCHLLIFVDLWFQRSKLSNWQIPLSYFSRHFLSSLPQMILVSFCWYSFTLFVWTVEEMCWDQLALWPFIEVISLRNRKNCFNRGPRFNFWLTMPAAVRSSCHVSRLRGG